MISFLKRHAASGCRAGLAISDERIAVAVIERGSGAPKLTHCSVLNGSGDWARRTADATAGMELRRTPVTAVVDEDAYQLVLVECPQVPAEEVAEAVRWRIKDLVGFPTENAVIDTIDIPALANQASRPMVYAVAAQPGSVAKQVDAATGAGLRLAAIDIPEMCLRNIATILPEEEHGVALLHLEEEHGTLVLSRGGVLYLIRRIDTGLAAVRALTTGELTIGDVTSEIALEVQRSLDYFESHYDQRPISRVVLGPGTPASFAEQLGAELGLGVTSLDINDVLDTDTPVAQAEQSVALMAVGAALRVESGELAA